MKPSIRLLILAFLGFLVTTLLSVSVSKSSLNTVKLQNNNIELCLSCHKETLDKHHDVRLIGCTSCHLGNPLEGDKSRAHKGMVKNPGELKIVHKTCGQPGCHHNETHWVKNSLMATNRGIISTLMYYFGETNDHYLDISVADLLKKDTSSLALDYFKKLCGTCHLYLEKGKHPDFLQEKGGGCTACHYKKPDDGNSTKKHPIISKDIPMENCIRCHNRSGRIGLSYQGIYENEGYGAPFNFGNTSDNQLQDGRYVTNLKPDIHFTKGLVCIDCHTIKEVMGDGKKYAHFEEQLEVKCETCHSDIHNLKRIKNLREPKLDLVEINGEVFLQGKHSKKLHPLKPPKAECKDPNHKDLSCQSCHSPWVPQCYGCHIKVTPQRQKDHILGKETLPRWTEYKSYMRYDSPTLGVSYRHGKREIVVLVPG